MTTQNSSLIVSLLASLWVAGAAPAIAAPHFSASEVSANSISVAALAERICGENPAKKKRVIVECDAIVKNTTPGKGGTSAKALELVSAEPLVTRCGLWDFQMSLGSRINLHLVNRGTGQAADFALRSSPGLRASWALVPIGESPDLLLLTDESDKADGEVLHFEQCIPAWVFRDPELDVVVEGDCPICPDETDETGD